MFRTSSKVTSSGAATAPASTRTQARRSGETSKPPASGVTRARPGCTTHTSAVAAARRSPPTASKVSGAKASTGPAARRARVSVMPVPAASLSASVRNRFSLAL